MSIVVNPQEIAKASPKTKRAVRYEWELEHVSLDCIFSASNTREFRLIVESLVLQDARFERLPTYRQVALDAYIRGALDALARTKGLALSQPPDAVKPKPRKSSSSPPKRQPRPQPSVGDATTYSNVWPRLDAVALAARRPSGTGG